MCLPMRSLDKEHTKWKDKAAKQSAKKKRKSTDAGVQSNAGYVYVIMCMSNIHLKYLTLGTDGSRGGIYFFVF